jgi:hypothetical protein
MLPHVTASACHSGVGGGNGVMGFLTNETHSLTTEKWQQALASRVHRMRSFFTASFASMILIVPVLIVQALCGPEGKNESRLDFLGKRS